MSSGFPTANCITVLRRDCKYAMIFFMNIKTELHIGPKRDCSQNFPIFNRTSIANHNCSKLSLLTSNIFVQTFDIICLCETYLASSTDINDNNVGIPGYIIYYINDPSNVNRRVNCNYYKNILHLKVLSTNFLQ